jgi:hypothetical protein
MDSRASSEGVQGAQAPRANKSPPRDGREQERRKREALSVPIDRVLGPHISKLRYGGGGQLVGPCPVCGGDDRFWIDKDRKHFGCRGCHERSGDGIELLRWLTGCSFAEALDQILGERPKTKTSGGGQVYKISECTAQAVGNPFEYTDDSGKLLFQVARFEYLQPDDRWLVGEDGKRKKVFYPRRPDPDDTRAWVLGLVAGEYMRQGSGKNWVRFSEDIWAKYPETRERKHFPAVPSVPYRLPELLAALDADGDTEVYIVEGEAKVDLLRSWGLVATCNAGGAEKWTAEHSAYLRGARITILPDNDTAGQKHLRKVGGMLHEVGARVRFVELPNLPPKGDIIDWGKAGHTREEFLALADAAPEWKAPGAVPPITLAKLALPPLTVKEWKDRDLPPPDYLLGWWITTTNRGLLIAPTGLGKTNFAMQKGYNISLGKDFLHWRGCGRPRRVLYIDGEMSRRLLRDRVLDCEHRAGETSETFFTLSHEDVIEQGFGPLNTPQGQAFLNRFIAEIGGVDLIEFDSIMCLMVGEMKEEDPWGKALPWIRSLTTRNIGQLWVHHTGHDAAKGYGTKTREWQMDWVAHLAKFDHPETDVSFTLEFMKARERAPQTRAEFAPANIALINNNWISDRVSAAKAKASPISETGQRFLDALNNVLACDGDEIRIIQGQRAASTKAWQAECTNLGLIDTKAKPDSARSMFSKYRTQLVSKYRVGCDGDWSWPVT